MSLRLVRGVVGVVAVACLLLAAAPAQAWLGGAKAGGAAERPVWAAVWQGVVDLWVAAQQALGLQATVAEEQLTDPAPEPVDDPNRDPSENKGIGIDPDGGSDTTSGGGE